MNKMTEELSKKWKTKNNQIVNRSLYESEDFKSFQAHMKILGKK